MVNVSRPEPTAVKAAERLSIDGHAHVFLTTLPMAGGRRYTPQKNALPERYFALLADQQLGGALLVQTSFLGTDNSYLLDVLDAARRSPTGPRLWGVAVLDPATPVDELRALRDAGIVGVRLNCFSAPVPDLDGPLWSAHLERVESIGWHVEVHIEGPRLPPVLDRLTRSNSRVVIDHFGLPEPAAPDQCPGFRRLLDDRHPGVCVKTSAPWRVFPHLSAERAARQCDRLARRLLDALGPQRLFWGSDWPWTQHEKGQTFAQCRQWAADWYRDADAEPGNVPDWLLDLVPS